MKILFIVLLILSLIITSISIISESVISTFFGTMALCLNVFIIFLLKKSK